MWNVESGRNSMKIERHDRRKENSEKTFGIRHFIANLHNGDGIRVAMKEAKNKGVVSDAESEIMQYVKTTNGKIR